MNPRNSPFPLQLAIQGGGAKICALLAAMEAIQSLQRQKVITVKRIAGTSAGAIVGSLFAAGVDMAVVRERLRNVSSAELARRFPPPGVKSAFTRLFWGRPLWKEDFLIAELGRFLEGDARLFTFRDLQERGIELLVVAANLTESGKIVHGTPDKDGKAPNAKVIEALLDSCGLPFCFRTWNKSGPVIVDGGICENLPSDELLPYEASDGPVIGITFDTTRGRVPNNFKDFSVALLDTAMNNSMSRAKLRLGTEKLFSIATDIGTFDFQRALTEGLADPEYNRVKNLANDFFQGLASAPSETTQTISREVWEEQNTLMMNTLGEVYKKQHEPSKLRYKQCSLVIQANSLSGDDNVEDSVIYRMEFATLNDPIYCHTAFLSETEDHAIFGKSELTVLDPTGAAIEMRKVPIRDPDESTGTRVLLFFLPPLKANTGSYTMIVKDVIHDAVKPLREGRKDELVFTPLRAQGQIDQIDLVLHWPTISGNATMVAKDGIKGSKMTGVELADYLTPAGFSTVGWTGKNVDSTGDFGVDLYFTRK